MNTKIISNYKHYNFVTIQIFTTQPNQMSKLNSKLTLLFAAIITFIQNTITAFAKPIEPCSTIGGCINGIDTYKSNGGLTGGRDAIVRLILDIARILVYISAAVAVIVIIFAGYKMLFANGNDEQFKKGKNTLVYAVIGLIVAIVSGTIVVLVSSISGFRLN